MQGIIASNRSMTDIPALIEPIQTFMLDVDNGHTIYVEEIGNPNGLPLITFHGGPGSYTKPKHRARYDLEKFRVILFDQRCGGQSRPLAVEDRKALENFSPQSVIADAERIRQHLGIDSWHVTGSSWGSTMALLYAVTYPSVTRSVTLRALFMNQMENWAWMVDGAQIMAPPAFIAAQALAEGKSGHDLLEALAKQILDGNDEQALAATNAIFALEHGLELLTPPPEPDAPPSAPKPDSDIINNGLLYAHVIQNHTLPTGWGLTEQAQAALAGKPFAIVHGACDLGCPLRYVYELQRAHPHVQLYIAPNAGHGVDLDGTNQAMYSTVMAGLQ